VCADEYKRLVHHFGRIRRSTMPLRQPLADETGAWRGNPEVPGSTKRQPRDNIRDRFYILFCFEAIHFISKAYVNSAVQSKLIRMLLSLSEVRRQGLAVGTSLMAAPEALNLPPNSPHIVWRPVRPIQSRRSALSQIRSCCWVSPALRILR
jgi:hypothetical protein